MDIQNPLMHSLSKMFRSCKSSDVSDVIKYPRQRYQLIELFSPKPCGPVYPIASFDTSHEFERKRAESKRITKKKSAKKGSKRIAKRDNTATWATSSFSNNYYDWSTSDDDDMNTNKDDKTTLFSSDSSDSFFRPKSHHNRRNEPTKPDASDLTTENDGFAVVKRSSDPYSDFMSSMVEMILEKQIFRAKELEGLLDMFLSLNSSHHHLVIIEVFAEIWETIFSDWR